MAEPAQALFDRFCADMDDNLREMAIGDLAGAEEDAGLRRGLLWPHRRL